MVSDNGKLFCIECDCLHDLNGCGKPGCPHCSEEGKEARINELYKGLSPYEIRECVIQACESTVTDLTVSEILQMGEESNYSHQFRIEVSESYEEQLVEDHRHTLIYREEMALYHGLSAFEILEGKEIGIKQLVRDNLDTLSERERRVVSLRFGLEDGISRTLEEVGKEFGVTRERVRQIEAKALRKVNMLEASN